LLDLSQLSLRGLRCKLLPRATENAMAAFVDDDDDGRLTITPLPGGEKSCAATSPDEENKEVPGCSEEVDWWQLPLFEAVEALAFLTCLCLMHQLLGTVERK
jgi:hypothetical protein